MLPLKIKEVAIYYPENVVTNEMYIQHFEKRGQDVRRFLELLGRKERRINTDPNETTVTMALKAIEQVLTKAQLTADDLQMIIFTSQTPETTVPSNAMQIVAALKPQPQTITYDLNANCAGMTVALEQVSHYMASNTAIQHALIIGADALPLIANDNDPLSYAGFGDGVAAIIVERSADATSGVIDAMYHVEATTIDKMVYPANGLQQTILEQQDFANIHMVPFDGGIVLEPTYHMFDTLFEKHHIDPQAIKYCFTQFAYNNIAKIKEHYHLRDEQVTYVGDRFAYTGTSSPFFAFHEGIQNGTIQRGDIVLLWTIGAGFELIATLIRY
ncbi:3-oxoacyl-[acyl-carrier-protein] synthase III C-terminal domain-containing protein [Caryophanon tenue]|uniref:3-oxoacyl-ACP synthase n=1 Tax=Caryophanon tenue TaxID=33978 RepID=A0A1C0YD26_9BACL|nr:3-oxoacyl-[acyl-carrier-protein] synthase III C-terminal domain-containing protein [Caryophanon tenue]OCS85051.1 3-oxoacyl-ACP synthase [Caryophanon tenue]